MKFNWKNSFLLLGLLLFTLPSSAQFELEYVNSMNENPLHVQHQVVGSDIYQAGSLQRCFEPAMSHITTSGTAPWVEVYSEVYGRFTDVLHLPDSLLGTETIVGAGIFNPNYDIIDPIPSLYFYTPTGIEVGRIVLPGEGYTYPKMSLVLSGANEIVTNFGQQMYRLSPAGQLLAEVEFSQQITGSIEKQNDNQLVTFLEDKIVWLNNNLAIQDSFQLSSFIRQWSVVRENIYTLTPEAVNLLNRTGIQERNEAILESHQIYGLSVNEEYLFVWGRHKQSDALEIIQLDPLTLERIKAIEFGQDHVGIEQVTILEDQLLVGGFYNVERMPLHDIQQAFLKTIPLFEAPTYAGTNISIEKVRNIATPERTLSQVTPDGDSIFLYSSDDWQMEVEVFNHGPEPLTSFGFFTDNAFFFGCDGSRIYQQVTTTGLPAGQRKTFRVGAPLYFWAKGNEPLSINSYVFAPNHHFDSDWTDNMTQVDLINTLPPSAIELPLMADWQIYPNPVNDWLQVRLTTEEAWSEASYRWFDSRGQLLDQQPVVDGQGQYDWAFDTSDWAAGLYFFEVRVGTRAARKRVLVIH